MTSPLTSVPFIVKLPIAIVVDILSTGVQIAGIGLAPVTVGTTIIAAQVIGWFISMFFLAVFHNWAYGFSALIASAVIEAIPAVSYIPMCSIMTLWNGYKTGWRY